MAGALQSTMMRGATMSLTTVEQIQVWNSISSVGSTCTCKFMYTWLHSCVSLLSGLHSPWYKSVISLGIGLYMAYSASGLQPSVYKSHRDLYLIM